MKLVDTQAWVWWMGGDARLTPAAANALNNDTVGVSAITCWEVAMLVHKGRLRFHIDVLDWLRQATARPGTTLIPITPSVAVRSTRLGPGFHRDPHDALIVATAIEWGVPLVTSDREIRAYPAVETIW